MTPLLARDALTDRLVRVGAETRPSFEDLARGHEVVYAVFEQVDDGRSLLGLVDARRAMRFPQRIFADLLPETKAASIHPNASLSDVQRCMLDTSASALAVVDDAGNLVGAVTRQSVCERLLEHERRTVQGLARNLAVHEGQRRLLAFEIHDGVAQYAAAAHMHLEACAALQGAMNEPADREFKHASVLLEETLREARCLMQGLHSHLQGDLVDALQMLIQTRRSPTGPAIEFASDGSRVALSEARHLAVYRIVQEALANAIKHSGTKRIRVELSSAGGSVRLVVRDWGRGFTPDPDSAGHGLPGMRRRAALLGGELRVNSAPEQGATIEVVFPESPIDDG